MAYQVLDLLIWQVVWWGSSPPPSPQCSSPSQIRRTKASAKYLNHIPPEPLRRKSSLHPLLLPQAFRPRMKHFPGPSQPPPRARSHTSPTWSPPYRSGAPWTQVNSRSSPADYQVRDTAWVYHQLQLQLSALGTA